jgi:hypothetical protein
VSVFIDEQRERSEGSIESFNGSCECRRVDANRVARELQLGELFEWDEPIGAPRSSNAPSSTSNCPVSG